MIMVMFCRLPVRSILALVLAVAATMASTDINNFFPDINGNLTKITWAHAVNSHNFLMDTLKDETIMMIEADVLLGQQDGYGQIIPIMAHPPETTSNLSLLAFFFNIENFNSNATNTKKKGVKLDFKTIEAFLESVDIVQQYSKGKYPIWINADIIPGPVSSSATPVDPDKFLNGTKSFPNSVLSIGWTTQYGSNYSGSYDSDQIKKMTDAIARNSVTHDITFPVRAGLAAESVALLVDLVKNVEHSTLTIWSSEGDNVDIVLLRQLIAKVGISKVYVDVPSDLLTKLHLDDLPPNSSTKFGFSMLGVATSVLLCFINYLKI